MKNGLKSIALLLGLILCLTGCTQPEGGKTDDGKGTGEKFPLAEVSDFTFDFETCAYSFTGTDNATFYYIKVYPVKGGAESKSASFQSDKIDAAAGNSYSGTVAGQTLLAGDYNAYVMASAPGYQSSYTKTSGACTLMAAASVTANWNTEGEDGVTADITITAGDEIVRSFTLTVTDAGGNVVYSDSEAAAGAVNLTAADLGSEALSVEDAYTVLVAVNQVSGYRVPEEAVSTAITERRMWGGPGGPGGPG